MIALKKKKILQEIPNLLHRFSPNFRMRIVGTVSFINVRFILWGILCHAFGTYIYILHTKWSKVCLTTGYYEDDHEQLMNVTNSFCYLKQGHQQHGILTVSKRQETVFIVYSYTRAGIRFCQFVHVILNPVSVMCRGSLVTR